MLFLVLMLAFMVVLGVLSFLALRRDAPADVEMSHVDSIEAGPDGKRLVTIIYTDGSKERVAGHHTCWNYYPSGKSCSTRTCAKIMELLNKKEFEEFEASKNV